ncbi:Vegetative incompatibility protein HET-E-1 [Cytospora mali]|uniref:Vegetative incompatibility protein HET-E-1 n=1 Tax=Cytospora mali TaxID=578113 RepID=A0A194VEU7_CYTMA|nr:Vegetative incompatibility protein HET-E-1 [Valsa mali var. pyri (nom. inval.)]
MWLLDTLTLRLGVFEKPPAPYATFSCFSYGDEGVFEDLTHHQSALSKPGLRVLQDACLRARDHNCLWLWSQTVCIDKRSSAALSESINSLAQIYQDAALCIVYLDDFPSSPVPEDELERQLLDCNWTRNVWTIPHIIFSRIAYFYGREWTRIGTKASLLPHLSSILGIDEAVLRDSNCLEDYSIGKRMSWASGASASRVEDEAHALLGLFNVTLPILYGEGSKAFLKLQEEIMKDTDDYSLFAWQSQGTQEYRGIFAQSPAEFCHFHGLSNAPFRIKGDLQIHCAGISIQAAVQEIGDEIRLPLERPGGTTCWISLSRWEGNFVRSSTMLQWDLKGTLNTEIRRVCVKRDVTTRVSNRISRHRNRSHQEVFARSSNGSSSSSCKTPPTQPYDVLDRSTFGLEETTEAGEDVRCHSLSTENLIAWSAHAESSGEGTPFLFCGYDNTRSTLGSQIDPEDELRGEPSHTEQNEPCDSSSDQTEGPRAEPPSMGIGRDDMGSPATTEFSTHEFTQLADEATDVAVTQFLSEYNRPSAKRSLNGTRPGRRQKRARTSRSPSYMEVEDVSDPEDDDAVIVRLSSSRVDTFACPFYFKDRTKNRTCLTHHQLSSTEDVREHLCLMHIQPLFCSVCKDVFHTCVARDDHIRSRTCAHNAFPMPDGVTDWQAEQLYGQTSAVSDEAQWFKIWDIIFPQTPPPASPFFTTANEYGVCHFRNFWMRHGQAIISEFLEKKDIKVDKFKNEERTLAALYQSVLNHAVDRVFDEIVCSTE